MSGLRWSEEMHAAWKAREAARAESAAGGGRPSDLLPDAPSARGPVTLCIPFPPTVNHSSGPTASGGRYLTAEHKAFRAAVAAVAVGIKAPRLVGRLRLRLTLFPPDRRRFDLDNRIKATQDALQHAGVYDDDWQIDELCVLRVLPTKGRIGSALVTIETIAV